MSVTAAFQCIKTGLSRNGDFENQIKTIRQKQDDTHKHVITLLVFMRDITY